MFLTYLLNCSISPFPGASLMQLVEIYKEIERFREEVIKVLNSDVISPLEVSSLTHLPDSIEVRTSTRKVKRRRISRGFPGEVNSGNSVEREKEQFIKVTGNLF